MCHYAFFLTMQQWKYRNCLHFVSFLLKTDFQFFLKRKRNFSLLSFVPFQGPFYSWIPPFSGILQQQQQAQIPGQGPLSLSTLDQFAGLFPNQITFPGQVSFDHRTQIGQLDPSQSQTPVQIQQDPNHVSRASSILLWGEKRTLNVKININQLWNKTGIIEQEFFSILCSYHHWKYFLIFSEHEKYS